MNAVQREYLRNAQKAVRVAGSVTWNPVAYAHQVQWAEAYWQNYLKSTGIRGFQQRMTELMQKGHVSFRICANSKIGRASCRERV